MLGLASLLLLLPAILSFVAIAATTAEAAGLLINLPSHQDVLLTPAAQEPSSSLPESFGYLLFPGFYAIDVFGPLDSLNILSL